MIFFNEIKTCGSLMINSSCIKPKKKKKNETHFPLRRTSTNPAQLSTPATDAIIVLRHTTAQPLVYHRRAWPLFAASVIKQQLVLCLIYESLINLRFDLNFLLCFYFEVDF